MPDPALRGDSRNPPPEGRGSAWHFLLNSLLKINPKMRIKMSQHNKKYKNWWDDPNRKSTAEVLYPGMNNQSKEELLPHIKKEQEEHQKRSCIISGCWAAP